MTLLISALLFFMETEFWDFEMCSNIWEDLQSNGAYSLFHGEWVFSFHVWL